MINLKELSKKNTKNFDNETETYNFVDKLTKKANKFGYAVFYKVSPNNQNISYNIIEKIKLPLNS